MATDDDDDEERPRESEPNPTQQRIDEEGAEDRPVDEPRPVPDEQQTYELPLGEGAEALT
jgi:hypothetical protein